MRAPQPPSKPNGTSEGGTGRQQARITRGKESDRSARRAHEARLNPPPPNRYHTVTYAMRIGVNDDLGSILAREGMGGIPNLSNRWRPAHGKRGGWRRRYEPYREATP